MYAVWGWCIHGLRVREWYRVVGGERIPWMGGGRGMGGIRGCVRQCEGPYGYTCMDMTIG